jgi:hypothetical protein
VRASYTTIEWLSADLTLPLAALLLWLLFIQESILPSCSHKVQLWHIWAFCIPAMILLTWQNHQFTEENEQDGNGPVSALLILVGAMFNLVVQLVAVLSIVTCHRGCNRAHCGGRDTARILPPVMPIVPVMPVV